jgi:hypothetical protein
MYTNNYNRRLHDIFEGEAMPIRKRRKISPPRNLRDRVCIKPYNPTIGKTVELRGALGLGGVSASTASQHRSRLKISTANSVS